MKKGVYLITLLWLSSASPCLSQWGPERTIKSTQDTIIGLAVDFNDRMIAADTFGRVHVVWTQCSLDSTGIVRVYYMRSTDWGNTWEQPQMLVLPTEDSQNPSIAADGRGNVHVVWMRRMGVPWAVIMYRRSTDGGQSWQPDTTLVDGSLFGRGCGEPMIAADERGDVHLVWQQALPGGNAGVVAYKRSSDGGTTWSRDTLLHNTALLDLPITIALDSQHNPHICWDEYGFLICARLWCKGSSDGGLTWNPSVMIADSDTTLPGGTNIAIDGLDRVYVFFMAYWGSKPDSTWSPQIVYRVSEDTGRTFGPRQALTVYPYKPGGPSVTGDINGGVHVVWSDTIPGISYGGLVYNGSTDGGSTWYFHPYFILVNPPGAIWPSIACDSRGKAHLVYLKNAFNTDLIMYRNGYPLGVEERTDENLKLDQSVRLRIFPNPMRTMTKFLVQAPGSVRVTLRIYDITGRLVRDLSSEVSLSSGIVWWDGKDERGRLLPPGVYLSRLEGGCAEPKQERLVILR